MSHLLNESLQALARLSPRKLHQASLLHRRTLGSAEWHLALCLWAAVQTMAYRTLGYAHITEYAEQALNLSGRKAGALLSAARALQHLPILSDAFRSGEICWAKLRAFIGQATPDDEQAWLEYARRHRIDEIVRHAAQSPKEWKRQQALKAALEGRPLATKDSVGNYRISSLQPPDQSETALANAAPLARPGNDLNSMVASAGNSKSLAGLESPPRLGPRLIRLVIDLTPDQYALYERAEGRLRSKLGKRTRRADVLTWMAETVFDLGEARSRAKHQVVIYQDASGERAWYETDRGILPVDPSVLEKATKGKERAPIEMRKHPYDLPPPPDQQTAHLLSRPSSATAGVTQAEGAQTSDDPTPLPSRPKRRAVPNDVLRRLFARAGHRCERCGRTGGQLDVHHRKPVSEAGTNEFESLELRCKGCHGFEHQADFETKPSWAAARAASRSKRNGILGFGPE